jgi:hypothetical protein
MKGALPDIAKLAARTAASIEVAVSRFSRSHRYCAGADLRKAARHVVRCTAVAWREQQKKLQRVYELSRAIDDLKIEVQIADLVRAWGSKGELEANARLVNDLGRQVGGWIKALQSKGQNGSAERRIQRAPILSSRDTPQGVHP